MNIRLSAIGLLAASLAVLVVMAMGALLNAAFNAQIIL